MRSALTPVLSNPRKRMPHATLRIAQRVRNISRMRQVKRFMVYLVETIFFSARKVRRLPACAQPHFEKFKILGQRRSIRVAIFFGKVPAVRARQNRGEFLERE